MITHSLTIQQLADTALRVELGATIDPDINARALALATAIETAGVSGVVDLVPSYTTVLVTYDLERTDGERLAGEITALAEGLGETPVLETRERVIPVVYGGPGGPDLDDVAAHTGLSRDEVIRSHAAGTYRVACIGFSPGYGLLLGLPESLATPRRATPRVRVPEGSVAIGGGQTGVYVQETPGGWNVIGHARQKMFDLTREDPFFLRAADTVHFVAIDAETDAAEAAIEAEQDVARLAIRTANVPAITPETGRAIVVKSGGAQTSIQDLGRPGQMRMGVIPGGALDRRAFILGNRLVGNPPEAAGLECTLVGPTLEFTASAVVAVTGGDLGARLNGREVPRWQPFAVAAGDELAFAAAARPGGEGIRAFVCMRGGIVIPEVFGSQSTDLFARFGGIDGRALKTGDVLPLGSATDDPDVLNRRLSVPAPVLDLGEPIRVTLGPQEDRFTASGIETFFASAYTVSRLSDRLGLRLEGEAVALTRGADTISEGLAAGAIQVPGNGQPILLLPTRATVGGYPKIGTAISADFDRMGQAGPGDVLRFAAVPPEVARELGLAARTELGLDAVIETPGGWPGWAADAAGDDVAGIDEMNGWNPAAVERLLRALHETGATRFRLELSGPVNLSLEYERQSGNADLTDSMEIDRFLTTKATATASAAISNGETTINAPLLGIFSPDTLPDEPVFVQEGEPVAAGATLGLIEVMKTYHEVFAPAAGSVIAYLVDDGATVQFGEPLIRFAKENL